MWKNLHQQYALSFRLHICASNTKSYIFVDQHSRITTRLIFKILTTKKYTLITWNVISFELLLFVIWFTFEWMPTPYKLIIVPSVIICVRLLCGLHTKPPAVISLDMRSSISKKIRLHCDNFCTEIAGQVHGDTTAAADLIVSNV